MGKTFKMSATIVQYAICTSAAVCATAGSCCSKFATSSGGTIQTTAGTAVCWNAGSAVNASGVIPQVSPIGSTNVDSAGKGYLTVACPAVATGSSTLAVSAAVAATAVYMM